MHVLHRSSCSIVQNEAGQFAVNVCLRRRVGTFSKRRVSFHVFHLAITKGRVMPRSVGGFITEAAA